MAKKMTKQEAWDVKLLICKGFSQIEAARAVGISGAQVSRICAGDAHRDVAWPNPVIGERLMSERKERKGETDRWMIGGAEEIRGIGEAPKYVEPPENTLPAMQTLEMNEDEAIEQAREQATKREAMRQEIFKRVDEDNKEQDRLFRESMRVTGPRSNAELPPPVSFWTLPFLEWEEVVGRAEEDNEIVATLKESPDEIVQRAIGIVFLKENNEDWDDEQTLLKISSVVEQLRKTKK